MLEALIALRTAGAEVVYLSGGEAEHLLDELDAAGGGTLDGGAAFNAAPFTGEARTLGGRPIHVALAEVIGRFGGLLVVRRDVEGRRSAEIWEASSEAADENVVREFFRQARGCRREAEKLIAAAARLDQLSAPRGARCRP